MSFSIVTGRTKFSRGLASRFAMALALAGGAIMGSAAIAPAAFAQENSRGFVAAYTPVAALTTAATPDWAGARAQFETLVAAIENEDDRNIAGNLALQIGSGLSDPVFQRRGLEMMLQSGKVAPAQLGQFNYFVGSLAFQAGDFAAARTALQASIDAGYTENDPRPLIMQSYFEQDQIPAALDYMEMLISSGATLDENMFLVGLQKTYSANLAAESLRASTMLVTAYPTSENWKKSLQVMNELAELDEQAQLDLLRLMRTTGAMSQRQEYVRYIENADPRIMANEVLEVLAEGVAAGHFSTNDGDNYYPEVKAIADTRAPADRSEIETTVREGQSGTALDASVAGDVLYSLKDFARAETMYQLALEKGGDRDTALTRVGMAQVMQGKYAEAIATLGPVDGARQPVASLWSTWAKEKMGA